MSYKHRWFYAGILVVFVAGLTSYYDIRPHILQNKTLRQALQLAQANYAELEESGSNIKLPQHNPIVLAKIPLDFVNKIAATMQLAGLKLLTLTLLHTNSVRTMINLRIEAQGTQVAIAQFFAELTKQNMILFIQDFQIDDKINKLTLNVIGVNPLIMNQSQSVISNFNLFCSAQKRLDYKQPIVNALLSVPLNQMRMVGFIRQGGRVQALVMLPNAMVMGVSKDEIIGTEKAKVTTIDARSFTVQLANADLKRLSIA